MTKLPLIPHSLENNRNSNSASPNKRIIIQFESNYDHSNNSESNLLATTLHEESGLILTNGGVDEKESSFPFSAILDSQHESNAPMLEADSEPRTLDFTENKKSKLGESVSDDMKMIIKQKSLSNPPPLWGFTSICGRRKEMEDSVIALPKFLKIPSYMLGQSPHFGSTNQDLAAHLFGVYDGHGGCQVANYCRDRLHHVLSQEFDIAKENWRIENGGINWEENWMRVFLNCFNKVDDEVGGVDEEEEGVIGPHTPIPPIAPDSVGSTAVIAVVCSTHLIVANCGDSRAVLCRGKAPIPLSVDHKPNREDECNRIEAAGGKVINWDGYRVSGFLAVSRSIGDRYLRPYVIADPEVVFVSRAKEDECLIIASDGLWDVVTNEEACDFARRRLLMWHKKNGQILPRENGNEINPAAQDAADYLSQLALQRGSRDNISVVVIDLKAQRKFRKKNWGKV